MKYAVTTSLQPQTVMSIHAPASCALASSVRKGLERRTRTTKSTLATAVSVA